MAEETKFTKAEVKFMYRAFKTECPNGIIDEETFKGYQWKWTMAQGNASAENYVEPHIISFWVKRLTDQGKLPEDCMTWRTPSGDRIGDIIKKADQIAEQNLKNVNLFDPYASRRPTTSLFEPDPNFIPGSETLQWIVGKDQD